MLFCDFYKKKSLIFVVTFINIFDSFNYNIFNEIKYLPEFCLLFFVKKVIICLRVARAVCGPLDKFKRGVLNGKRKKEERKS